MKKTLLLGALVASTMAFASMGSVTVKGGLSFDANSTPSTKYELTSNDEAKKEDYKKRMGELPVISAPSFGLGLSAEYSNEVYRINDKMSLDLAGGLSGSVKYASSKGVKKVQKYKFDETSKKVIVDGKPQEVSTKLVMTSISALVGPRFNYKLNDDVKLIAGVNLGIGGEIHTVVSSSGYEALKSKYDASKKAMDTKDGKSFEGEPVTKEYLDNLKKEMDVKSTFSTVAFPISAVLGVDYKNIVATVNLGGKVLVPNYDEKDLSSSDIFSFNVVRKENLDSATPNGETKATPKFIFSAGLEVGYRFDLDKFMK